MPIKIYMDESVPVAIAAGLHRRGVDVRSARDAGNLGLTDEEQLSYAEVNQLVIFTHDTDFLRLAHTLLSTGQHHCGVIYVHQDRLTMGETIRRLKEICDLCESRDLRDHIEFL